MVSASLDDAQFLADDLSQLLALGDALSSREPAMIASTVDAVIRTRGVDSLATAGGVDSARLRQAVRTLGPDDLGFLNALVERLLAESNFQATASQPIRENAKRKAGKRKD